MCQYNALWIDDIRPQPDDDDEYVWANARSFHEAIIKLELLDIDHVSFDHDIASFYGDRELTGYDIAMWLVGQATDGIDIPTSYDVHSANPVGRERIQGVIDRYLTPDDEVK